MACVNVLLALAALEHTAHAQLYWDTSSASGLTAGSGTWDSTGGTNWATSASPGTAAPGAWVQGSDAYFQTAGANVVTLSGSISAGSLVNQTNNTLTTMSGPGTLTLTGSLAAFNQTTLNLYANTTVGGNVILGSSVYNRGDVIGGNLTASGSVSVTTGWHRLSGNNSFSALSLAGNNMILAVASDASLGNASSTIAFNSANDYDAPYLRILGTTLTNLGSHTVTYAAGKGVAVDVVSVANTFTFNKVLAQGGGKFAKQGAGTLVLNQANTSTGQTIIYGGTLRLDGANGGTLASSSGVNVSGGNFHSVGSGNGGTISINGLQVSVGGGSFIADGNNTFALGNIFMFSSNGLSLNIEARNSAVVTTTLASDATGILNARFTFNGSNWAARSGSNIAAYSGYANLATTTGTDTANSLATGNVTMAGSRATNTVKITTSATGQSLNVGAGNTLTLTAGGLLFAGADSYSVTSGTLNSNTATNSDLVIHQNGSGTLTISSIIANGSGTSTLTKSGAGTLKLDAPLATDGNGNYTSNPFTGSTYVNGGTLSINHNSQLGAARSQLFFNGGTIRLEGAFASLGSSSTDSVHKTGASTNRDISIGGSGGTIDVVDAANSVTISGGLSGQGALTKEGAGTLIVSNGNNAWTGGIIVNNGVLQGPNLGAFDTNPLLFNVASGNTGTLRLAGFSFGFASLNTASGMQGTAVVENANATAATLTIANGDDNSFAGGLRDGAGGGALSLFKGGAGTLSLSGSSGYTGTTTISNGALEIADGSIASSSAIVNYSSLVYKLNANARSYANPISGIGSLTKSGTNVLTLSGTNTYTGATSIAAGVLSIAGTSALQGTSGLTINGGAGLTYTGSAATFSKNITVTGGTGSVTNSGSGVLTLGGTLTKNGTVLRLTGGAFNVTGQIVGSSSNSDLVVDAANVTLSNTNSYNGPTYVYNSGTLSLGVDNAIPNLSRVELGNATTRGTLVTGTFSDSISQLVFTGSGGTVSLSGDKTSAVQVTTAGSLSLGSNASLALTSPGTTLGLYRLISYTSRSGTFADTNVSGLPTNYTLLYTGTEIDMQRKSEQAATLVYSLPTSGTVNAFTNTNVSFSGTLSNLTPTDGAALTVSLSGSGGNLSVSGLAAVSGSTVNANSSSTVTGTIATGATLGARTWSVVNTDTSAITSTTSTANGTINVFAHGTPTLSTQTINFGRVLAGTSSSQTVTVSNGTLNSPAANTAGITWTAGSTPSGFGTGGSNQAGVVASGSGVNYTYTLATGSAAAYSGSQTFSFSDDSSILGSGTLGSIAVSLSGTVVNQRTFTTSTSTLALGNFRTGTAAPVQSVTYSSTGGYATTASGTIQGFTGGPAGFSLGIFSGSSAFVGSGTATQSTTYQTAGSTATAGALSGTFTAAVAAELGSIPSLSVAVTGTAYDWARAQYSGTTIDFGIVHKGASPSSQNVAFINPTVTNAAFQDSLTVSASTGNALVTGSGFSALAAGSGTGNLAISIDTSSAGSLASTLSLTLSSIAKAGTGLADGTAVTVGGGSITTTGGVFSGTGSWNQATGGSWGTGASDNWTSAESVAAAPGTFGGSFANTDTAIFAGVVSSGTATVSLNGAAVSLASMAFSNTAARYVIATGTGSGSLTLAAASGAPTVDVVGTHEIAAGILGTSGLSKTGLGTLVLSGSNGYSGATTINSGVISFANKNAFSATSGISIGSGAGLTYTGAADTFSKDISVTSGTGTVTNSGGQTLTLGGTLTKNGTVLRLTGGAFNVTGLITGTSAGSDLVVDAATVTLSNTNTYNGPTYVYNSGTLSLGADNTIPNTSAVYLGDSTTRGTLVLGSYTDSISQLIFSGSGGTLSLSGDKTASAQLATNGSLTLGSNASLVLTNAGTSAGLYRLISATSISGSFASITGMNPAYQILTTSTSIDYQQRAVLGAVTVTNPAVSIITGGSAAFTYTVANTALSNGASLSFTGTGLTGVAGSSSGSASAAGTSTSISGLVFTGTTVGNNQQGTFTVSAPTAYGSTTATGTVSVNVLDHSNAALSLAGGSGQTIITGGTFGAVTFNLTNAGSNRAAVQVSGLVNLTGSTGGAVVASGGTATYTGTGLNNTLIGANNLVVSATAGDQSLSGANPLTTLSATATYTVLDHSNAVLSLASGGGQTIITGGTFASVGFNLTNAGSNRAAVQVDSLTNLTGVTGTAVVLSGGTESYTASILDSVTVGSGTLSVGMLAGDQQSLSGASALQSLASSASYTVLDHATSSLAGSLLTSTTISLGQWNYSTNSWESGSNTGHFSIYNIASIYGAIYTADLSLLGVTGTGNGFTTNLGSYADIAGGQSTQFSIFFDPTGFNTSSTQSTTFQIQMADKTGMSGATASNTLYVTANVIVVPEPGAIALAGIGVGLAGWSCWKRRRTANKLA